MIDANELYRNIWIGGWSASSNHGHKFDAVVNVAKDAPHSKGAQFLLIDGPGNDPAEFEAAVRWLERAIEQGGRILVHCVAGRSRSLIVASVAISRTLGVPFDALIDKGRKIRNCEGPHQPHPALMELAKEILKGL